MDNQDQNNFEDRYVEISDVDRADQATPVVPDEEAVDLEELARPSDASVLGEANPADVYEQSIPVPEDDGHDQG